jgi:hypothetical protein
MPISGPLGRLGKGARVKRIAGWTVGLVSLSMVVAGVTSPAFAASRSGRSTTKTGNDISYPQCGGAFPSGQAFGLVGVNGGLANDPNPCLGPYGSGGASTSELYWAEMASTGALASQPKAGLYVNTADPADTYNGQVIADWPKDNTGGGSDPYGLCSTDSSGLGANSTACAWQYGWNLAQQDAQVFFAPAASALGGKVSTNPGDYRWWLDVETVNSWQSGTSGQEMNDADIEGMVAYLSELTASGSTSHPQVGIYSTSSQWSSVTGGSTVIASGKAGTTISDLPDWVAGARSLSAAQRACTGAAFSGGGVQLSQWIANPFDGDVAC